MYLDHIVINPFAKGLELTLLRFKDELFKAQTINS